MSQFVTNSFQVPNAFVDLVMGGLSRSAIACYLTIVRKTLGWQKEYDAISASQFMEFGGISKRDMVYAAIKELEDLDLIVKVEQKGKPTVYKINLEPTPKIGVTPTPKNGTPQKQGLPPENGTTPTPKIGATPTPKNGTHKRQEIQMKPVEEDLGISEHSVSEISDGLMFADWQPEDLDGFRQQLRRAMLPSWESEQVQTALVEFTSYWQTRSETNSNSGWTHKFLQNLMRLKAQGLMTAKKAADPSHQRFADKTTTPAATPPRTRGLRPLGKMQ